MRLAYLDCFSGISGDMTLGALVDAGVDPAAIIDAVGRLGLPGTLAFEPTRRGGFRATHARVEAPEEHVHRHLPDIERIIDQAALPDRQADLAKRIFQKLGEAEAAAHGIHIRRVHFHEVGAVDSIIDIVGAAVGFDLLGVDRVECSPVPTGRGFVMGAHGRMPIPTPGTAELLRGVPLAASPHEFEMTTPTGAAIVATMAQGFGTLPPMTVTSIGYGAGTKDIPGHANLLRIVVGDMIEPVDSDRVWQLETNLDDIPAETVGYTTESLLAAGALDAFVVPILMKKNRPGSMLTVLCDELSIPRLEEILFRETRTLGIRRHQVVRSKQRRQAAEVDTAHGAVRGKLAWRGDSGATFAPEYDDCARIARDRRVPLLDVYQAANAAFLAAPESARRLEPVPTAPAPQPRHQGHAHHHHEHTHDHDHEDHDHDHHHPHHEHPHPSDHGSA